MLTMAIRDVEISAVCLFAVFSTYSPDGAICTVQEVESLRA